MSAPEVTSARQGVPEDISFQVAEGVLCCDGVPLTDIAAEHGTPTYVYGAASIDDAYARVEAAMSLTGCASLIAYAVKSNGNLALLARLAARGAGADIVSVGELQRALRAGVPVDKIVFSGVGKRRDEIRAALEAGIRALHVESAAELDVIEDEAKSRGVPARIALRVNPDVDAGTHPYIATGLHDTKFGLPIAAARALLPRLVQSPHLRLEGVACHIGSQLKSAAPLREAVGLLARFGVECRSAGAPITSLDVGGGWPMHYGSEATSYPAHSAFGEAIRDGLADGGAEGFTLITEPGRALVGGAGALLTRVLYVKRTASKHFVIVDAAMTELIRPALYQSYHAVQPVQRRGRETFVADVVGPVCESGDFLALDRSMPVVQPGDLLAIRGAGAYGRAMASAYNGRPPAAEVLCEGGLGRVIRRRATVESLWADEVM